jgi:hypothetical protein
MRTRSALAAALAVLVVTACGGGGGGGDSKAASGPAQAARGGRDPGKVASGGEVVAQSDFVLEASALPFENYGNEPGVTNLTPDDMRAVYGDAVCATTLDGTCLLSPPAQLEMDFWNQAMAGGHCFGFSVASLLFSERQLAPDPFGAPQVGDLVLEGNTALQRRLAQGFMAQGFVNVREAAMTGSPNAVLKFLIDHFNDKDDPETYTLGFFKPDGTGGHAVTPYAVVDRGNGKYGLRIYDNNIPGEPREMTFNTRRNTWSYYAAPIPDAPEAEYSGDASLDTLELYPTSPGLGVQPCWFCGDPAAAAAADPFQVQGQVGKLFVSGSPTDQPKVLLTDAEGRRTGYVDGKLLTEIPGVKIEHYYFANMGQVQAQPVYRIPLEAPVRVTLEGSGEKNPEEAKVGFTGPGFAVAVGNLEVDPGQTDELTLPSGGQKLAYQPGGTESPTLQVGVDGQDADYALEVSAAKMRKGSTIELDLLRDRLSIDTKGKVGDLGLRIDKVDTEGKETFDASGLKVKEDEQAHVEYDEFDESGDSVTVKTEDKKTGKVEEEQQVADEDKAVDTTTTTTAKSGSTTTSSTTKGGSSTTSSTSGDGEDPTTTSSTTKGTRRPSSTDDSSPATTTTKVDKEPPARGTTTTTPAEPATTGPPEDPAPDPDPEPDPDPAPATDTSGPPAREPEPQEPPPGGSG